jgi:hypothetical protein
MHKRTSKENWLSVKVKLLTRFGSIKAAAAALGCHRNAPRLAALGFCPDLAKEMKRKGVL